MLRKGEIIQIPCNWVTHKIMKFYIVDVFAEQKYQGNQLAVLLPDRELTATEMQQIARETNFSETSFILSGKRENGGYEVRIFTPDVEVPFAGHPSLGTAYVINKMIEGGKSDKVILNLRDTTIPISIDRDGLTMEQDQPSFGMTVGDKKFLADVLNINEEDISKDYPVQLVSTGLPCIVTPLKTVDAVRRCSINHDLFRKFIEDVYRCNLLVFTSENENELKVRVFMDDTGFLEDPATGSANGNLAGYLLKHDYFNKSRIQYNVNQGDEINRPSLLRIKAEMEKGVFQIRVGGNVHLVADGEWFS